MEILKPGKTTNDTDSIGLRDAAHCPVVTVRCWCDLKPGQDIYFDEGNNAEYVSPTEYKDPCGMATCKEPRQAIADPFVTGTIKTGTVFLAFVVPSLVSNIAHAFDIEGFPLKQKQEPIEDSGDEWCYRDC